MPQLAEVIALARQIKAAGDIAQIKHIAGRIARGDCADTVRNDAEFKESDHPRAEDGKFGGGAGNSKHISSVEKRATYIMPGKHDGIVKGEKVWRLPDAPDYFLSKDGNYFKDEGNGITKKLKSTSKESVIQHIENRDIERQKEKEKASEPNNKFIDSAAKFAKERGMEYRIERPNDASSRYMYLETKFGTKKIRIADHPQPTFFNSDTQKYETRGGYDKKGAPHDPADYSFTTGDNPADVHKIISALAKGEEPISYGKGWNKGESEWDVRKRVIQGLSEETSSDSANPSSPKDQIIQALRKIVGEEVRNDADHWITVNSGHGEGGGTPALIGEDGTVKAGMGGKFNGKNIKDAHGTEKFTSGETNKETEARNNPKHGANVVSHLGEVIDKNTTKPKPAKEVSEGDRNNIARSELLYKKYGSQEIGGRGIFKEKARSGELDHLHEEHLQNEEEIAAKQKEAAKAKSQVWKDKNLPKLIEAKRKREEEAKLLQEKTISAVKEYYNNQTPEKKAERSYLNVPYSEKDHAKQYGAKWDADKKKWYFQGSDIPEKLKSYVPQAETNAQQTIAPKPQSGILMPGQVRGYPTSGRISDDDPSIYGSALLGHEGESWASFHSSRHDSVRNDSVYTDSQVETMNAENKSVTELSIVASNPAAFDYSEFDEKDDHATE